MTVTKYIFFSILRPNFHRSCVSIDARAVSCFLKQVIYVDVLFALNMLVSFLLIKSAASLCREKPNTLRVLIGSLIGGIYSLSIFLPPLHILFVLSARAVFLGVVCLCVFGFGTLRRFMRCYGLLCGVTLGFAGFIMAVWFLFRPQSLAVNNGSVYFDISFLGIVFGGTAVYIAARIFSNIFEKCHREQMQVKVNITYKGKTVTANGLIDTGNTLKDSFSGKSVSVISRSLALELLPLECAAAVFSPACGDLPQGMHLTVSQTVGGTSLMCVFAAESMVITSDYGNAEFKDAAIAVGAVNDFGSGCSVLLNADTANYITGGREYDSKNQRVDKKGKGKVHKKGSLLHKRPRNLACTVNSTTRGGGDEPY